MIATEKRPTSHRHTTNLPVTYSTQERFMLKLTPSPQINPKNSVGDDELGIFEAEKYFTGAIDEPHQRSPKTLSNHFRSNGPQQKHEEPPPPQKPKSKTASSTPSVRSESSWNSQRGLLATNGNDHRKRSCVKSLLASLGCNCNDEASVTITGNKVHVKEDSKQTPKMKSDNSVFKFSETKNRSEDSDCFTFPVLNASMPNDRNPGYGRTRRVSSDGFGSPVLEKGKKSFSLERKLSMLNWDGVTPRSEIMDVSRTGGHNDTGSDASSDLFEIESFSTNENNSFIGRQASDNNESHGNGYAPSEASVDWSVVTASAVEDSTSSENVKAGVDMEKNKSPGILSGCKNVKAVRVSGGGEKTGGGIGPVRREWNQRLDSVAPVARIQADTKLMGAGSDSSRGQNGFRNACSISYPNKQIQYNFTHS